MARRRWTGAGALVAAVALGLGGLGVGLTGPAAAAPETQHARDGHHQGRDRDPRDNDRHDRDQRRDGVPRSASAVVGAMQPGWNLGNTLDAVGADETAWGNPRVTPELFDALADAGFRSVRIPVTWGQYQGAAPDHTVDPAAMDRVEEVVDEALDAGLYVLLDVHHDSWMWADAFPQDHDAVLAQLTSLWQQIAERFRDHPRSLLLESLNEPQFANVGDDEGDLLLDELNQAFTRTVRATGGGNADRVLVLPTLHTDAGQARLDSLLTTFDALDDENLAATFHYYGYWPFSVNVAGGYRYDATAQADTEDTFARVEAAFVDRGIPVILGEYGLLGFDRHTGTIERGEKLKFFEHLGALARSTGVTTMLWDNGQHLDRTTFRWQDPELYAAIATSWRTRSGTGSTDQVFVRPDDVAAQTVTLDPHGQRVTGVWFDGRRLRPADARLTGDDLTLSAALLGRVVAGVPEGSAGWLEVRFNRGLPWRIEIIAATTPVLSASSGSTDAFAIPTAFHGDRLATMEAHYADGTFAGPHGWTSYKEYDVAFAPDDASIVLTPAFFAEVTDGTPVRLTFHFWSGETVEYTVTRTGTTVTGTPA
ncbi:Cellulase [Xylanimonas cellulosilytica DSM 15894]|uniref:Cellulase n=1 Tax=Xylanimonas cellulosilytica (strain DSM 15894 / JCM 12276 / CECT 5975 / KCTC 9989 / LMG 20990 / NBRC 107835 / XIL07) TaxID=446471 RepID=D1BUI0_XYLCX|nr:cellulase family glycosylhydrolase [Xylanimonas cellulosilytica]ACZ29221.1 Cellulase [Xylanimonas cellulosilytica DSM 15894]